jgi:DNA-directed RNA polymerase specialized sigma24 family protein
MATLDQLPAEQRAIVELVVQRGRSYDALAEVLQVPAGRVRELARDALAELSPRTAARVDPDWRGRVADYLLGQQAPADARATRDYLKKSESARAWALSLLDSLDPLYEDGSQPAVPDPGDEERAEPEPEPEAVAEAPTRARARETAAAAAANTVEDRARERARKRPADDEDAEESKPAREPARKREPLRKQPAAAAEASTASLSPEARAAVKRRRVMGAAGGLVLLAVIVVAVLALTGAFDSSGGSKPAAQTTTPTTSTTGQQPLQVLGQIPLSPIGKTNAQGVAYVVQQAGKRFLVVQAQVPPLPATQKVAAYEVWLFNSNSDARSLGAQYTNAQGQLQGRADLPADFAKFKNIDVSRELFSDKNTAHSNNSVLRGAFSSIKPVPQQQGSGASTTPQPGATTP